LLDYAKALTKTGCKNIFFLGFFTYRQVIILAKGAIAIVTSASSCFGGFSGCEEEG
jgi:hypothetical protein